MGAEVFQRFGNYIIVGFLVLVFLLKSFRDSYYLNPFYQIPILGDLIFSLVMHIEVAIGMGFALIILKTLGINWKSILVAWGAFLVVYGVTYLFF